MKPIYSICVPNYNMEDTLRQALVSVLEQLDDTFEVLVVDDGSSDKSVDVLEQLAREYNLLRVVRLFRDSKRRLGETRNISVREARGKYVILHVDGDDVWEPYIKDFVSVFHKLESCLNRDFLLSGQQINMGKRDFLLEQGPYRNIYHVEDRDMWIRLAAIDAYIPLVHRVFRTRLIRHKKTSFFRILKVSWHHMLYDIHHAEKLKTYVVSCLIAPFYDSRRILSYKNRILRFIIIFPCLLVSRFTESFPLPEGMKSHASFVEYRERVRGTFSEIMKRHGCDPDLSFLNKEAQLKFSEEVKYSDPC